MQSVYQRVFSQRVFLCSSSFFIYSISHFSPQTVLAHPQSSTAHPKDSSTNLFKEFPFWEFMHPTNSDASVSTLGLGRSWSDRIWLSEYLNILSKIQIIWISDLTLKNCIKFRSFSDHFQKTYQNVFSTKCLAPRYSIFIAYGLTPRLPTFPWP